MWLRITFWISVCRNRDINLVIIHTAEEDPFWGRRDLVRDKMHCMLQAITRPIVNSLRSFLEEVFDQLENELHENPGSVIGIFLVSQGVSSISVPSFFASKGTVRLNLYMYFQILRGNVLCMCKMLLMIRSLYCVSWHSCVLENSSHIIISYDYSKRKCEVQY